MAGTLQFLGDASLKFKDFDVRSGTKGMTTHFRVTCPNVSSLVAYHNYIVTFGASATFRGVDGGEDRELEVEVPGLTSTTAGVLTELFFDSWELLTNECSDSIFNNPLMVAPPVSGTIIPGASAGQPLLNYNDKCVLSRLSRDGGTLLAAISSCDADVTAGMMVAPTVGNGTFGGGVDDGSGVIKFQKPGTMLPSDVYGGNAAFQVAFEILMGQTEYKKPTYVLRHTSYCSAAATYNTSTSGTQKIYSPSQLLTECGSGWTYNLPPRLYSKIAGIQQEYAALHESPYYTWGWFKSITREPVLSNFMVEVNSEYELALWSNIRYGLKT